jgi:hypothetical protein
VVEADAAEGGIVSNFFSIPIDFFFLFWVLKCVPEQILILLQVARMCDRVFEPQESDETHVDELERRILVANRRGGDDQTRYLEPGIRSPITF